MKRIDAMNRRNADLARELAALKAQQAELASGRTLETATPTEAPTAPATLDQQAIEAAAEKKLAERTFNEHRAALIQNGVKELGPEAWNQKTDMLAKMGALDVPAFMDALLEVPEAHRLVAALADDPDRLMGLMGKRPAAMAAEMGRMAAEMTAPKTARLSSAPAPVQPLNTRGGAKEPDIYDTKNMSTREWIEHRNRTASAKLGGPRRRSA
jgi:hypothetical protein